MKKAATGIDVDFEQENLHLSANDLWPNTSTKKFTERTSNFNDHTYLKTFLDASLD